MADPKKDKNDEKKDEMKNRSKDETKNRGREGYRKMDKHRKGSAPGFFGRGFVIFLFILIVLFGIFAISADLAGDANKMPAGEMYSLSINKGEEKVTVTADNTTVIYTNSNHPFNVLYDDADGNRKR